MVHDLNYATNFGLLAVVVVVDSVSFHFCVILWSVINVLFDVACTIVVRVR